MKPGKIVLVNDDISLIYSPIINMVILANCEIDYSHLLNCSTWTLRVQVGWVANKNTSFSRLEVFLVKSRKPQNPSGTVIVSLILAILATDLIDPGKIQRELEHWRRYSVRRLRLIR